MSTNYPGDDPQPANDPEQGPQSVEDPGTASEGARPEQGQPVGYWERQAAERAAQQAQGPEVQGPGSPPDDQPQGQPYGSPPGYAASYPPYAAAPGQPPFGSYGPAVPDHRQATTALVLGLVGLIGGFVVCGLPLLVSPFAWAIGRNAVKEIEASQGALGGAGQARAGMVLGIIGTVLLVLVLLGVIAFAAFLTVAGTTSGSPV